MKNKFVATVLTAVMAIAVTACSFSTANISSFKIAKDKEAKQESTTFQGGETFYGKAVVSNASKVAVKFYLVAEDVPGIKKGDTLPGSEIKVDLASSGTADFNATFPPAFSGKLALVAELLNENGEKKESKSLSFTVTAAAPAVAKEDKEDKEDKGGDGGKDEKEETKEGGK